MGIREALERIATLLDDVEVKGKDNMRNIVESMELIEDVIALYDKVEKEVTANNDGH